MFPRQSTEMFINLEDVPEWDHSKHYFEQKKTALQFYDAEFEKIKKGVTIGGYHIHPWLYFHLNFFVTPIPTLVGGKVKDVVKNPPLDDNIMYIIENLKEAERLHKVLFLFGCRGFTKTSFLASYAQHTIVTTPDGVFSIIGGDDVDLGDISALMERAFTNIHPAFFIPTLNKDWDDRVSFGFRDKANTGKKYNHADIVIKNANRGTEGASEKGAGGSPIGYIMDECGKYAFKSVFESAIPSFKTQFGYRTTPILSGTSGNTKLSKDAREVLENPAAFDVLPFNFDTLSNMVPPEHITWGDDKERLFGTFVPGQMSYRLMTKRVEKPLDEFLGLNNKDLKKLKIQTTNWKAATEEINSLGGDNAKEGTKNRNRMYYPLKLDDCFLTTAPNPFPTEIIDKRIRELKQDGGHGKNIEIYRDAEKFKQRFSLKTRAEVEHKGGHADAPVVLYDELPETPPEKYLFVSGLDDYKTNEADTDSLGSFYVVRRRNLAINTPCETVVASYSARTKRHRDFHATIETMIEAWAAECLMESADVSFEDYLEVKGKADKWLAPALTFAKSKDSRNSNAKLQKKYGLYPTTGNNQHRHDVLVDWTWEEHTVGIDAAGNEIKKLSVEFLDDIELLEELKNWRKGKNSDRMTAFSHAILHARELDIAEVRPKSQRKNLGILKTGRDPEELERERASQKKKSPTANSPYTTRKLSPYSFKR